MAMEVITLKGDQMVSKILPISSAGKSKEACERTSIALFEPGFHQINWISQFTKADRI